MKPARVVFDAMAYGVGAMLGEAFLGPLGAPLGAHLGVACLREVRRAVLRGEIERALTACRRLERARRPTARLQAEAQMAARALAVRALEMGYGDE